MRSTQENNTNRMYGHGSAKESGMALFIVLVLVLVLTVVISQMVFVTQVEKRISQNRQGFTHLNYALQASSRLVMQKISEDLMEDIGLLEVPEADAESGFGSLPGSGNSGAGANPGQGNPGEGDDSDGENGPSESSDDPVDLSLIHISEPTRRS